MRRLIPRCGDPALRRLATAQDEPDDLAAVGRPYRQRAGEVVSESQPA